MAARTVATGSQVLPTAARLMPMMQAVTGSTGIGAHYTIAPGTVDQQQGLIILGQASSEVFYIHDATLKALPIPQFLQGYMIGQVASAVYQRTAWIIPMSQITMTFGNGYGYRLCRRGGSGCKHHSAIGTVSGVCECSPE